MIPTQNDDLFELLSFIVSVVAAETDPILDTDLLVGNQTEAVSGGIIRSSTLTL